ncbi:phosphoribulokinase [Dissulfurimicrobium hydrothermale]|uniref:phosphoribulokinase n=1 Tax=Dissulfurimicrobium hydrothermale TaxID=1750598 RepID=UPI001EDC3192|nr:phosphoribulokinase [Dissulfurimicrobium hydrothermale]UKL14117.1 phosphoribulokinase [Dissulfurimicrobium hydrothermale]
MGNNRPILLGVVGDSGTGKTTFTKGIEDTLGPDRVTVICIDDYHRYNRVQRKEKGISALHPECNYIDIMEQHLYCLRRGEPILKPVYNHSTGCFDPPEYIKPKEFVIIEGLLGFYTRRMRDVFDVKLYLDPEKGLRVDWKIARDTQKRGYTRDDVIESLKRREEVSKRYIRPQRVYADIVVSFYRPKGLEKETGSGLNVQLILRPTIRHPDLSRFIDSGLIQEPCCISATLGRDDGLPVDIINITQDIAHKTTRRVMKIVWDHLPGIAMPKTYIGKYHDGNEVKISNPLAIAQLIASYHLMNMKLEER